MTKISIPIILRYIFFNVNVKMYQKIAPEIDFKLL